MAVKYSIAAKELFVQILARYPIVEEKKTDTFHIEKKRDAWEKITAEFNAEASETRTITQLKRLWDKMKRSRKAELAQEKEKMLTTDSCPTRTPLAPQAEFDKQIPYIDFKIVDVKEEFDGITEESDEITLNEVKVEHQDAPASSSFPISSDKPDIIINPDLEVPAAVTTCETKSVGKRETAKRKHLSQLTEARLQLIQKEGQQMDELHRLRMEEAYYRREGARLQMLQEEIKLKKLQENYR